MTKKISNPDQYWDYTRGCWYCRTITDAVEIMQQHPSETIMLFDRNKDGKIVNTRVYYEPGMDKEPKFRHVKHGKLIP